MSESEQRRIDPQGAALTLRVLNGELGQAQVWFDAAVLDRYVAQRPQGTRVIRTNSAGRVKAGAGWSLDFGIAEGDVLIHASAADLSQRLPAGERSHWAQHATLLPSSRNFLSMRLHPGSCLDDGDLRDWAPPPSSPEAGGHA